MKKDAFYFPHFSGARHDRKIKRITKELGLEGYAIYFMLLEVLREQVDYKYPLSDIDLLADEFGTSDVKIKVVISKYDLFQIDDTNKFFSIKQIYYLQPYIEKSNRARVAAQKRWDKVNTDANGMHLQYDSNADAMQTNKTKEKKIKEKKTTFVKPSNQDVIDFLINVKQYNQDAESFALKFISYYEANGWRVGKNPMKNWQSAITMWISKEPTNNRIDRIKLF